MPVPDLRGNSFSFSPFSMVVALGLSYVVFIMLRYIPSTALICRLKVFIMNRCNIILSNAFSSSTEMIIWFSDFILLKGCIQFIDLQMLNHSYIHHIHSTWSWWMIFLVCCCIWFTNILLRIFESVFNKDCWSIICFCLVFELSQWTLASQTQFRKAPSLSTV